MIIGMSHEDLKKLRNQNKKSKPKRRVRRAVVLSDKTKKQAFKNFEKADIAENKDQKVVIDEHVKLNDSFLRTGWYVPKKKKEDS